MADYSYLMKGIVPIATDSSVLVSSSKYLNDARVRDWVATHLLRRNGPDVPTPSDSIQLVQILREVQDIVNEARLRGTPLYPVSTGMNIGLTLLGIPVYFIWKRVTRSHAAAG